MKRRASVVAHSSPQTAGEITAEPTQGGVVQPAGPVRIFLNNRAAALQAVVWILEIATAPTA